MLTLLEVESKDYHLAARFVDGVGVYLHILVLHVVDVRSVEVVGKTIHKLQLRSQFEERQVEIATHTQF